MNDIISFSIHRMWKNFSLHLSSVRYGQYVLDIAGGTGDLSYQLSNLVGDKGKVILADINKSMLKMGKKKIHELNIINNITLIQANAEYIPFPDNYFDCIIISFGLRNISNKEKALKSMFRVLKKGARLLILDFSSPHISLLNKVYDIYSFYILKKIGKLIIKDPYSYLYLTESIRIHPDQEMIKNMMKDLNFKNVLYFRLTGGIVSFHLGFKI